MRLLETENGRCTATEISNTGDLLTARHCLQICLIRSGVLREKLSNGASFFELERSQLGKAACRVNIDGEEETVTVQATSPGLILYSTRLTFKVTNPEAYERLRAQGYMEQGDFAIVRRERPSGHCLPLGKGPLAGELRSLGYPAETHRPDGFNSDGKQLYFSQGKPLKSVRENSCFGELDPFRQEQAVKDYDHPGATMATIDAYKGSSGSAVVNEWGEVTGLLAEMYVHHGHDMAETFCRGGTKALSIDHLRPMFGELKLECVSAAQGSNPSTP